MVGMSSWEALSNTKNSEIAYYLVRYRSAEVFIFCLPYNLCCQRYPGCLYVDIGRPYASVMKFFTEYQTPPDVSSRRKDVQLVFNLHLNC